MDKIAILGSGGLGANLAMLAAEQGLDVLLVDADVSDPKFFTRFGYFTGRSKLVEGLPKVDIVRRTAQTRGKNIDIINAMVDENFDFGKLAGRFVIIAIDTAGGREVVEVLLNKCGLKFMHVGCNLGSVSIWKSMRDTISTDPDSNAQTSYDRVPDALTYMVTAVAVLQTLVPEPVKIWQEE